MKILIAADIETGESIVEALGKRSWTKDDEFRVASVIDTSSKAFMLTERSTEPYLQERAVGQLYVDTAEQLAKKIHDASPSSSVSTCLLDGSVPEAIVSEAENWHADLIAIGSHHWQGLTRIFEGSVSQKVLKDSKCSLLIVPVRS
jgi:nucleotide-binding universal stress UspA family protein